MYSNLERRIAILLVLLLAVTCPVLAQEAPEETGAAQPAEEKTASAEADDSVEAETNLPASLDDAIQQAMAGNPDIALAEANVLASSAELRRTRMDVTRKVMDTYRAWSQSGDAIERAGHLHSQGRMETTEYLEVKAAQDEMESELRYLLGTGTDESNNRARISTRGYVLPKAERGSDLWPQQVLSGVPRPAIPEPMASYLDNPVNLEFEGTSVMEMLVFLSEYFELAIVADTTAADEGAQVPLFNLKQVKLKDALLAVTDGTGGQICFAFRDYGLLLTTPERAMELYAPTIPGNIPMLASAVPENADAP